MAPRETPISMRRAGLVDGIALVAIIALVSSLGLASAEPPPIPADYSGYAAANGEAAPEGSRIHAEVLGYSSSSVAVEGGRYLYLVIAPPDSGYEGETIEFYLDPDGVGPMPAVAAAETSVFQQGSSHDSFNLTFVVLDVLPPVIVNVASGQVTTTGATITWVTDEPSTSLVEYGEDESLGLSSGVDPGLVMGHSVGLTGLSEGSVYYYRVFSSDEEGNAAGSSILSFTTSSAPPPSSSGGGGIIILPGNEPPVAEAGSGREVYVGVVIRLSGAGSVDPDGVISVYHWFFGDGGYEEGVSVSHSYSEAGSFTAALVVTDSGGATDTDNCTVTVLPLPAPVEAEGSEAVAANRSGHVVDASLWADTVVTLNTTGPVTVTVLRFGENPHPGDALPEAGVPKFADVYVSDPDAVEWPIYVEMAYSVEEVEGLEEGSLGMYCWRGGGWLRCLDTGVDVERMVVWAYMSRDEASGSPILIGGALLPPPPRPAEFHVAGLTVEPVEVEAGGRVDLSVVVANLGEEAGNFTVHLDLGNGSITAEETVNLVGGESEEVAFVVNPEGVGVHHLMLGGLPGSLTVVAPVAPAEFRVTGLAITPDEVSVGEGAVASVTVENTGGEAGSYAVALDVGGDVYEEEVNLEGGASTVVEFSVPCGRWGTFDVVVGELSGELRVFRPAEFQCTGLTVEPGEVEEGGSVSVSVDVCNLGEDEGMSAVELRVDGAFFDSVEVALDGGATATASFDVESGVGSHSVAVGGLEGRFTVSPPPEPPSPWAGKELLIGGALVIAVGSALMVYSRRRGFLAPPRV